MDSPLRTGCRDCKDLLLLHTDYMDLPPPHRGCMDYTHLPLPRKDYTGCKDLPPPTPAWR